MAGPSDNLDTPHTKENNTKGGTNTSGVDQHAFITDSIKALQALIKQSQEGTSGIRPIQLDFEEDGM
jgi:hypothetical protein